MTPHKRRTFKAGDGIQLLAWPNSKVGGHRKSYSHCPIHAGCGNKCTRKQYHVLCKVHEMAAPSDHGQGSAMRSAAATRKPDIA